MKNKITMYLPPEVKEIFSVIKDYGSEAFIVGGSVRDAILSRPIHDYDICTPVPVVELEKLFIEREYHVIPTGIQHGTITVMVNGKGFEITTYRKDGEYSDGRHPDSVEFTSELEEDLARRDFTINAMAYNDEVGLVDPFGGLKDIKNKTIRCVGNPDDRFKEDALRILRAWRFSCVLNFSIDLVTLESMHKNIDLLDNISKERIRDEFLKSFNSNGFIVKWLLSPKFIEKIIPELKAMHMPQNNPYHIYYVDIHTQNALATVKGKDLITRLAVLFHDIGKPHSYQDDRDGVRHFKGHAKIGAQMTDDIMRRLRFDNDTRKKVVDLVLRHDFEIPTNKKQVKRWLNKIDEEQFLRLLAVKEADIKTHNPKVLYRLDNLNEVYEYLEEIHRDEECFSLKDLAINGNDVKKYMYVKEGKDIGYWLNKILQLVIDGILPNDKDKLIEYMVGIADGWIAR